MEEPHRLFKSYTIFYFVELFKTKIEKPEQQKIGLDIEYNNEQANVSAESNEAEKKEELKKTKEIIIEAGIKDEQINQIEMPPK